MLRLLLIASFFISSSCWALNIDKQHSKVGFIAKLSFIAKVNGQFKDYTGDVAFDKTGKLSQLTAKIQTASISTGINLRDNHLRENDFFDAAQFPEISFLMTRYEGDDKAGTIVGNLTMRGITKEISLPATITSINDTKELNIKGSVNRTDFSIGQGMAAKTIGEEVALDITLVLK